MERITHQPRHGTSRDDVKQALWSLTRAGNGAPAVERVLGVVDKYAATVHTKQVYTHAERIAREALLKVALEVHGISVENFLIYIRDNSLEFFFKRSPIENDPAPVGGGSEDRAHTHNNGPGTHDRSSADARSMIDHPHADDGTPTIDDRSPAVGNDQGTSGPAPSGTKRCTICREVKQHDEFNRNRARPDGRRTACRACDHTRAQDYRDRTRAILANAKAPRP